VAIRCRSIATPADEIFLPHDAAGEVGMRRIHACIDDANPYAGPPRPAVRGVDAHHVEIALELAVTRVAPGAERAECLERLRRLHSLVAT
jgi:hypothetical protein